MLLARIGLLGKFGAISAIACIFLGTWAMFTLNGVIRQRAVADARQEAVLLSSLAFRNDSTVRWPRGSLVGSPGSRRLRSQLLAVSLWDSGGELASRVARAGAGGPRPSQAHLGTALRGEISSRVARRDDTEVFEVYVPVDLGRGNGHGVAQVDLPYAPISKATRQHILSVDLALVGGLLLSYLVLLAVVRSAARQLRCQAQATEHQALHDALTGLPNRSLFRDRAHQAVLAAQRTKARVAILLMDLDRFKEINDTLGHHHGDLLLKQIGPRLRQVLRGSDTIARLGGDEFGVLLPNVIDAAGAIHVAEKIERALRAPFRVEDSNLHIGTSIGIAMHPAHGEDVDTLIQRADVAMYEAKSTGSGWETYSEERDQYSPGRLAMVGDLRKAVDYEDFVLLYQPKVDLRTGAIPSAEALARWKHAERGLVSPDEFIPMAERTGLIDSLTMQVLNQALRQCKEWERAGLNIAVGVNLSVRNLLDTRLAGRVKDLLDRWQLPPQRLELEITESTLMADPMRAMETLRELSELGIKLAVDDFGTGYSSLLYLKRFPVSAIKIDKSFIMNMGNSEQDFVIVRSTIDLGRSLGLEVVAEGVETEEVWDHLALLGCDLAQGYYCGKPVPGDDIPWLAGLLQVPWQQSDEPTEDAAAQPL